MSAISYRTIGTWAVLLCMAMPCHLAAAQESSPSAEGSGEGNRAGAARGSAATAPGSGGSITAGGGDERRRAAGARDSGALSHQPGAIDKPKVSSSDGQLLRRLAQVHLAEIKMASLATAISGDEAIRLYGRKMLEEHYDALEALRRLALPLGVVLPGGVDTEQAAVLRKQALLAGPEFDRAYLQQAGLDLHASAHETVQALSKAGSPAISEHAALLLPVLDEHANLAQAMSDEPSRASAAVLATLRAGTGRFAAREPGGAPDRPE